MGSTFAKRVWTIGTPILSKIGEHLSEIEVMARFGGLLVQNPSHKGQERHGTTPDPQNSHKKLKNPVSGPLGPHGPPWAPLSPPEPYFPLKGAPYAARSKPFDPPPLPLAGCQACEIQNQCLGKILSRINTAGDPK